MTTPAVKIHIAELDDQTALLSGTVGQGDEVPFQNMGSTDITIQIGMNNPFDMSESSFVVPAGQTISPTIKSTAAGISELKVVDPEMPFQIEVADPGNTSVSFLINSDSANQFFILQRTVTATDELLLEFDNRMPSQQAVSLDVTYDGETETIATPQTPNKLLDLVSGEDLVKVMLMESNGKDDETGGTKQINIVIEP